MYVVCTCTYYSLLISILLLSVIIVILNSLYCCAAVGFTKLLRKNYLHLLASLSCPDNSSPDVSNPDISGKKCLLNSFKGVFESFQEEHQTQEWLSVIQQSTFHNCPKTFYTVVLVLLQGHSFKKGGGGGNPTKILLFLKFYKCFGLVLEKKCV